MKNKRVAFAAAYAVALTGFTVWLALDTFVIPHAYEMVQPVAAARAETTAVPTASPIAAPTAAASASSRRTKLSGRKKSQPTAAPQPEDPGELTNVAQTYDDGQTRISLMRYRVGNTTVYVADVTLSSPEALSSVLANDTYGRNVTEAPSSMAERSGAVLAVNGDYYGARQKGYVIRNGVLYRDTAAKDQQDLVIDENGDFSITRESEVSAETLLAEGAQQVLSFGPGLVAEGEILVTEADEVGQAKTSNPRTALAQVGPLHYLFAVADGRTAESAGLSLYELARFLQSLGAETAYNLDGGGSSVMVFNGQIVNTPTSGGRSSERRVSDIVAIF